MNTEAIIIRVARGSGRSIRISDEALQAMNDYIEWLSLRDKLIENMREKILQELQESFVLFSSLGMTNEEYWDYKKSQTEKTFEKQQRKLSFNRPIIKHQVINRKPKNLIKKIIH